MDEPARPRRLELRRSAVKVRLTAANVLADTTRGADPHLGSTHAACMEVSITLNALSLAWCASARLGRTQLITTKRGKDLTKKRFWLVLRHVLSSPNTTHDSSCSDHAQYTPGRAPGRCNRLVCHHTRQRTDQSRPWDKQSFTHAGRETGMEEG